MSRSATPHWEKKITRASCTILYSDYEQRFARGATDTELARRLFGRDHTTSMRRHRIRGEPFSHQRCAFFEPFSPDAAVMAKDWLTVLRTGPTCARDAAAMRALQRMRAPQQYIEYFLSRQIVAPPSSSDLSESHPLSAFVVEVVKLRRLIEPGPVFMHFEHSFQTGLALLNCCPVHPCIRKLAPEVWPRVLTFAPTLKEVLDHGDWTDPMDPKHVRLSPASQTERRRRYQALINLVPTVLDGKPPAWLPQVCVPVYNTLLKHLAKPQREAAAARKRYVHEDPGVIEIHEVPMPARLTERSRLARLAFKQPRADHLWEAFLEYCDGRTPDLELAQAYAKVRSFPVDPRAQNFAASNCYAALKILLRRKLSVSATFGREAESDD
jgi:hypothetical protein